MFESFLDNQLLDLIKSKGYSLDDNGSITSVKYFSNIDEELFSLYNGVGLRINYNSAIIELTGKDCLDFLHRITTNSILHIQQNEFVKTIFTNEKGRIIGLADVINLGDKLWLKTDKYFKDKIVAWINRYVISDDVNVNDISSDFCSVDFYGQQRNSFIEYLFNSQNIEVCSGKTQLIKFDEEELLFIYSDNIPSIGNLLSINLQNNQLVKLLTFIFENKGPFDFNLIGKIAFESYRIEQGILNPDNELNDNFNPHELNLSELIDTKKGCYIGQEVLARLETYDKVQKKISGLILSDDFELIDNNEIYDSNSEVAGYLTSKTYSYKLKKVIGLGLIKKKYLSGEEELFIKTHNSNEIKILVNNLPFIKK